jgi:hypothetical protein
VRPLGLGNGAFDNHMIYFSIIVPSLSLGFKVGIGASDDCKDYTMGWESFVQLMGFLNLWRRWRWWISITP